MSNDNDLTLKVVGVLTGLQDRTPLLRNADALLDFAKKVKPLLQEIADEPTERGEFAILMMDRCEKLVWSSEPKAIDIEKFTRTPL